MFVRKTASGIIVDCASRITNLSARIAQDNPGSEVEEINELCELGDRIIDGRVVPDETNKEERERRIIEDELMIATMELDACRSANLTRRIPEKASIVDTLTAKLASLSNRPA